MAGLWWTPDRGEAPPWPNLPEWKLRELLRLGSGEGRRLSLLGYAMLAGLTGADLRTLDRGGQGKPRLPDGPAFSLAHTRGIAVCALSRGPVGVDVERPDALKTSQAVAAWTVRECRCKYLGTGAGTPPPALPVWTGTLPGGFLAAVCTGERDEAVTVNEWKKEQTWEILCGYTR